MEKIINISDFIRDTYGSTDPDLSQIFSPLKTIKLKGELALKWKIIEGKISAESIPMEYLPTIVSEVNKNLLESVLSCANPEVDYFICFDELDLGMSLEKNEYKQQIIGLLLAARKINNAAKKITKDYQ
nr:hypothetical protein [Pseudoroseomonas aestuarii]